MRRDQLEQAVSGVLRRGIGHEMLARFSRA
jgi:hypothetical protein